MKSVLFILKIQTIKILTPYLVKFRFLNLLSILFILSLSKIKSILPKSKTKFRVIVFSKSGGIDDVIESQKKYNNHNLYLVCPRIFLITVFRTIFDKQEYSDSDKFYLKESEKKRNQYKNFLIKFLKILRKKYDFNSFIGFNFEFKEEIGLAEACKELKIPYLLLYKESVLSETEIKYLKHFLKKINQKFNGYKIGVYSNYAKKLLIQSNYVNKNDIKVIGCARLNQSFAFKKITPKNQILYYAIENERGLPNLFIKIYGNKIFKDLNIHKKYNSKFNWNFLHLKTLKILKKFALNNPETSIIIKIKTGQSLNKKQYSNLPKNIQVQYFGVGHQLIKQSKIIIAWNTTAILEGIAANRYILIPYFHAKKNNHKKENELILKLKKENYGYTDDDFYKKLNLFVKRKYKKNQLINSQYSLKYHLGNSDQKADYRLNKFIKKYIKYKI